MPSGTPIQHGPKLLDEVRDQIRAKHCSIRTETQYVQSVRRFTLFHSELHPRELMAGLLFGTGMRLMECVRLRVKDVEFAQRQIIVRDGRAPGIG